MTQVPGPAIDAPQSVDPGVRDIDAGVPTDDPPPQTMAGRTFDPADPAPSGVARSSASARIRALLEIVLCSGLPTSLLIGRFLVALRLVPEPVNGLTLAFVAPVMLLDTAAVIALMVCCCRIQGEHVRTLWLGHRPWTRETLMGIALVPVVFVMVAGLLALVHAVAPGLHDVPVNPLEAMATPGGLDAVVFGIVVMVAGGLREELQRAFMLSRVERHLGGTTVGVILLSAVFGIGHRAQGWDAVLVTSAIGAFWAMLYVRRRSSLAPIVSHAGFNSLEVLRVALAAG